MVWDGWDELGRLVGRVEPQKSPMMTALGTAGRLQTPKGDSPFCRGRPVPHGPHGCARFRTLDRTLTTSKNACKHCLRTHARIKYPQRVARNLNLSLNLNPSSISPPTTR